MLRALVPIRERVLLDVARVWMRALLCQIQLTIHVEVVNLLEGHAPVLLLGFLLRMGVVRWLAIGIVIVGASLAVGALLFDDELLTRVGVDLVDLGQLLLLLGLQLLRLLLLVLFQAFLALIACQFAVVCPFGHALGLSSARRVRVTRALRSYGVGATCTALGRSLARRVARPSPQVGRLDLAVDGVLILAGGVVAPDSNLTAIVLMVSRGGVAQHVHVRPAVRVVFLTVVGGKLIFVLQEAVLVALRAARAVADVAGDMAACARAGDTSAAFA